MIFWLNLVMLQLHHQLLLKVMLQYTLNWSSQLKKRKKSQHLEVDLVEVIPDDWDAEEEEWHQVEDVKDENEKGKKEIKTKEFTFNVEV